MRTFSPACLVLLFFTCGVVAAPPHAPLRPAGMGSAIAVEFSIHPDSLRPGEPVRILACGTNQNPTSTRDLVTGDALVFEFTRGTVGACSDVALALPTTTLLESDFACSVDGSTLTITYNGSITVWSPGEAICASVMYTPEDAPSMVLTQMTARRIGGHAPGAKAGVLLGVATDLGVEGPAGPEGPTGPAGVQGPPGSGGIGGRQMLVAAAEAQVLEGDPPVAIPGLETTIAVGAGSNLLVVLDQAIWPCHGVHAQGGDATVYIEVDGVIAASHHLEYNGQTAESVQVTFLTAGLAAGVHSVRGLVGGNDTQSVGTDIRCVGAAGSSRHFGGGRLIVMELLP